MLHHFATFDDHGPCVAYARPNGESLIVCCCTTERQAASEAARLNYEQARISLAALEQARAAYFRPRRSVRQFAPDQFA